MTEESSNNNVLTFILVFMLGFFFSKLMPDICRSMNKAGIMNDIPNPSNGIIQGFNVGGQLTACSVSNESAGNTQASPGGNGNTQGPSSR